MPLHPKRGVRHCESCPALFCRSSGYMSVATGVPTAHEYILYRQTEAIDVPRTYCVARARIAPCLPVAKGLFDKETTCRKDLEQRLQQKQAKAEVQRGVSYDKFDFSMRLRVLVLQYVEHMTIPSCRTVSRYSTVLLLI